MDNPPNSPDAKLNTDPKAAIQEELAAVKSEQAGSSWLRQGIDYITQPYHHESTAVKKLEDAAQQVNQQGQSDPARSREIASQAIKQMEDSRQSELDAYKIVAGAAKTAVTLSLPRASWGIWPRASCTDWIRPVGPALPPATRSGDLPRAFLCGGLFHKLPEETKARP